MFVCCDCCVLSGRGLCVELITRPEESYRLWCVIVCDLETSRMRRLWTALGRSATKKNYSGDRGSQILSSRASCWSALRVWSSRKWQWKFRFHKRCGVAWVTERWSTKKDYASVIWYCTAVGRENKGMAQRTFQYLFRIRHRKESGNLIDLAGKAI